MIQDFARPLTRPDWRKGSNLKRQLTGLSVTNELIHRAEELSMPIRDGIPLLIADGARRHCTENWVEILGLVPSYFYFYEILGFMLRNDYQRLLHDLFDYSPGGFQDFCEVRCAASRSAFSSHRWQHWPHMYTAADVRELSFEPNDFELLLEII